MNDESRATTWWSASMERVRRADAPTVIVVLTIVVALVSFGFAASRFDGYRDARDDARRDAETAAASSAVESASLLDRRLRSIAAQVDELAAELTARRLDEGLVDRIRSIAEDPSARIPPTTCSVPRDETIDFERALCAAAREITELNGVGVVFDAAVDPTTSYRPYANRINGTLALGELATRDFPTTDWYSGAVVAGAGVWTHPRFGRTSQTLLAFYSAPFFEPDGSLRGVVLATYALDRLATDLRLLDVGDAGYSIVLSDTCQLVGHPAVARIDADFAAEADCSDTSGPGSVAALRAALAAPDDDAPLIRGITDDLTEAPAWIAYAPIPTVDWTFGAIVIEREVLGRTIEQNRLLIDAGIGVLAGLLLLAVVLSRAHRGAMWSLWVLSSTAAVLAIVGIALVWYVTITGPGEVPDVGREVAPEVAAARADASEDEPLFAGVFVQSVEFTGSNDVTVSGIMWQEQRSDEGQSEPPGFVLPEADSATFTEQYRLTTGNLTRVGWAFTASLRQSFEYSRYPLDRETVWLRLWPADYQASWLMLPELTSYETLAPSTRPGIEQDFVVEGWELEASSFSYVNNNYNTDFGLRELAEDDTPELYFNVQLKRSFLDALMSQLVPLSVVAVLLFGVLLITKRKQADVLDFSALGVLGYCAALFFVVILSHTELRSTLNAGQVIYLEYFYFAAYLAILVVSANAILVGAGRGGRLVHYRDNAIPSLLFWPTLNTALLVVTLVAFY